MAYSTPTYDYGRQANTLTTNKGLQDIAQNYGRFLSQERFRRGLSDGERTFKQNVFPQIGRQYNRRGLYHSGLRQGAQRESAQDFQRQTDRFRQDYGQEQAMMEQQQAFRDTQYQQALLALYEDMQRQRAAGYDPFATIRGGL